MLAKSIGLSRFYKRIISVCVDSLLISIAFWGGYWVRLDSSLPIQSIRHWVLLTLLVPVTVFVFTKLGLYRAILRYVGFKLLWTVSFGVLLSTLCLVTFAFFFEIFIPKTTLIYFAFANLLIGGSRLCFVMLIGRGNVGRVPVLIYGAGSSGRQLQLALNQGKEFFPVAFVDDSEKLRNVTIHGINVYMPDMLDELIMHFDVKKILLAIPSSSRSERQSVIRQLELYPCEVLSIPGMADLVSGKAQVNDLKEVSIEDLLGRDAIEPIPELMNANITGKRVMVTGAGGSIGSELCRQIIRCKPEKLVIFELSEYALYSIDKELNTLCKNENIDIDIIPLLGSVQNKNRLSAIMNSFNIQTVYHAAAYKHVPLVEYNAVEGVQNNIFGTLYCAEAAIEAGVETFVLISTDKAVRPTNTMGATKRLAELVLQALSSVQTKTRFCMVRFGNVLGSSGSVIPLFRKQIINGGPLTVTHPQIIRYFMTIPEASQLVVQAGAMGTGGDVFVLDMGQPIKVIDLAYRMVRLSGLSLKNEQNPNGDIEVKISGLRPGEKLFEELLIGDNVLGTNHPRIMRAKEQQLPWVELRALLDRIDAACHQFDHEQIRHLLLEAPAAFAPTHGICDLEWKARAELKQGLATAPSTISKF